MPIEHVNISQTYTHLQSSQLARKLNEVIDTANAFEAELDACRNSIIELLSRRREVAGRMGTKQLSF